MEHITTLKTYKNALKAGFSDEQAVFHAESLNSSLDSVITNEKLDIFASKLDYRFELINLEIKERINSLKISLVLMIGGTFVAAFLLPIIVGYIFQLMSKHFGS